MCSRRAAIGAVMTASIVLLTGCGAARTPPYITRANAVCASVNTNASSLAQQLIAAAQSLGSSHERRAARQLAAGLERLNMTATTTLRKLRGLKLPTDQHPQLKRFLQALASATTAVGRALGAAHADQPQQALAELRHLVSTVGRITNAANASGLSKCATALSVVP